MAAPSRSTHTIALHSLRRRRRRGYATDTVLPLASLPTPAVEFVKMMTAHGRAGEVDKAVSLFEQMPHKNQVSWNSLLSVLVRSGDVDSARRMFDRMPLKNATSYATMIAGLSRTGRVSEARAVFDSMPRRCGNVFSWTAMVSCYAQNREPIRALEIFARSYSDFFEMAVLPNSHTFSALLKSCADVGSLALAAQIYAVVIKLLDEDRCSAYVHNALIHLHARLGELADAELLYRRTKAKDLGTWNAMMDAYRHHMQIEKAVDIFDSMKEKDIVSWNIVMSAFGESGRGEDALRRFIWLLTLSPATKPNASSYTIVLTVCATLSIACFGRQIHALAIKQGIYPANIFICNSLINMYASCGSKPDALKLFDEMPVKDVISLNTVILGLGQNGHSDEALDLAEKALSSKTYNSSTFVAILTCCSHGGLVQKGLDYFASMDDRYGIRPTTEHCVCVVDMLGRAGRIDEAHGLLRCSPLRSSPVAWASLLSACLLHGSGGVAEVAAGELRSLDPDNTASYVMMSSAYARAGRTDDSKSLLDLVRVKGLRRSPAARSWIAAA